MSKKPLKTTIRSSGNARGANARRIESSLPPSLGGPQASRKREDAKAKSRRELWLLKDRLQSLAGQAKPAPKTSDRATRIESAVAVIREELEMLLIGLDLEEEEEAEVLRKVFSSFAPSRPAPPSRLASPESAPELWESRDRNVSENPVQFTRRVYGRWIGKGLTRRDLRSLDPSLYRAMSVWMHRHPEDDIAELPPMSAQTDELIERLSGELSLDELRKLGHAIDSRLRRENKKS